MSATSAEKLALKPEKSGKAPASHSENLKGALFMVIAMAGFTINDTFVKTVGETLNIGQTLFIRGCFAVIAIAIAAHLTGQWRPIKSVCSKAIFIRASGEMLATYTFVTALFHIPMANVSAIYQALPLALTLYAAIFMREHVGWRRLCAILVGFLGVLIIIRPGLDAFNIFSIYVLVSVAGSVVRDVATRDMPKSVPSLMIAGFTAFGVAIMGGLVSLFEPWNPVGMREFSYLAMTSIFLIIGYFGVVAAMREGDVGFVSPFRYTVLIISIFCGVVFFDEFPDTWTLVGSSIVVASGVYTLYRERKVRRQKITQPPSR